MKRSPQVQIDELLNRVADLEDQVRYLREMFDADSGNYSALGNKADLELIVKSAPPKRRGRPPKAA